MLASCSDRPAVQKKACLLYFSCMGHFFLLSKSSTMSGKRRDVRGAMMAIEWSFSILAVTLVPIPIIIRHRDREREREGPDHGRIVTHSKHAITHSLCRRFHPWRPCGAIERSLLRKMYRRLNIYFPLGHIFVVLSLSIAVCVAVDLELQGTHCRSTAGFCLSASSSLIFQTKGHQKAIAPS